MASSRPDIDCNNLDHLQQPGPSSGAMSPAVRPGTMTGAHPVTMAAPHVAHPVTTVALHRPAAHPVTTGAGTGWRSGAHPVTTTGGRTGGLTGTGVVAGTGSESGAAATGTEGTEGWSGTGRSGAGRCRQAVGEFGRVLEIWGLAWAQCSRPVVRVLGMGVNVCMVCPDCEVHDHCDRWCCQSSIIIMWQLLCSDVSRSRGLPSFIVSLLMRRACGWSAHILLSSAM
jgi:hypothetical protein